MRKFATLCFLVSVLYSCKNQGNNVDMSRNDSPAIAGTTQPGEAEKDAEWIRDSTYLANSAYKVSKETAKEIGRMFRTTSIGLYRRDARPHHLDIRKNVSAVLDPGILKVALKYPVSVTAFTGGFPDDFTQTNRRQKPTIILRIVMPKYKRSGSDTMYFLSDSEELCPLPEPCP